MKYKDLDDASKYKIRCYIYDLENLLALLDLPVLNMNGSSVYGDYIIRVEEKCK